MSGRRRMMVLLAVMPVLAASCGGEDAGSDDAPPGSEGVTEPGDGTQGSGDGGDAESGGTDGSGDDGASSGAGGGAPDLDLGSMPPAGEVVFDVDGQTFTFVADEMDYFICDISDEFVNVRSESETASIAVGFDSGLGRGNATMIAEGSEVRYDSFFSAETTGGLAAEAPHVLFEGNFDASQLDNLSDITQVGVGQVAVTCP